MSGEMTVGAKFGLGYVRPIGQAWRPVIYTEVEGLAVVEGCIVLGTVDEVKETAVRVEAEPLSLTDPKFEGFGLGIAGEKHLWASLEIPFVIEAGLPAPERVTKAINHWQEKTKFRFVKHAGQNDFIVFANGGGCSSRVGRQGGPQKITLGDACSTGNAIHEIGHALGLWHEQSRRDRDVHVEVLWQNILPNARHNFEQHLVDGIDLGAYDFGSIMHYPSTAFGIGGAETLRPRVDADIGQRKGLSDGDVKAIAELYFKLYQAAG